MSPDLRARPVTTELMETTALMGWALPGWSREGALVVNLSNGEALNLAMSWGPVVSPAAMAATVLMGTMAMWGLMASG